MMSKGRNRFTLQAWLTVLCLGLIINAQAHDPGLSTAAARIRTDSLEITLAYSIKDAGQLAPLDADGNGTVTGEEFDSQKTKLIAALTNGFRVELDELAVLPSSTLAWFEAPNDAYCVMTFPVNGISNLTVQSKLFDQLPPGHRQFVTVTAGNGSLLGERLLSRDDNTARFEIKTIGATDVAATSVSKTSFGGFFTLGIEHILTGYDHLLFLFALLVVTTRIGSALKIITCFTLAHSITLAVSTLNLVQIPSQIVEPLIAASIVYVGIENLFRGEDPKGRWILTFVFGLIHGFGFASVLRELGVGANGSGVAMPLLSFNLGVEIGQILVAAIALPLIWKLRTKPAFVRSCVPACSIAVALAGSYWFIQRVWF